MAGPLRRAIIVGSEGQDGRILFTRLEAEGWKTLGIGRATVRATGDAPRAVDITSYDAVADAVRWWRPSAVFYLAAVHAASENVTDADESALFEKSLQVNVQNAVNFLEALSTSEDNPSFFYAASSHVFGESANDSQDECTPFRPNSVYAITKTTGIHACRYYRLHRNVRASVGILYNHESPFRSSAFVSRKIVSAAVQIRNGTRKELVIGDLSAAVDWGYAPDYVDAMLRIVELPLADDYVIATGEAHTVQEFVEIAFGLVGLDWQKFVREDRSLLRGSARPRVGNSARLRAKTGWQPSLSFREMVRKLVEAEIERHEP